jgi:hypothetical protein
MSWLRKCVAFGPPVPAFRSRSAQLTVAVFRINRSVVPHLPQQDRWYAQSRASRLFAFHRRQATPIGTFGVDQEVSRPAPNDIRNRLGARVHKKFAVYLNSRRCALRQPLAGFIGKR